MYNDLNESLNGVDKMKVKEAKNLYEAGVIFGFNAYRTPSKPDEWFIRVDFDDAIERPKQQVFITNSHGENKVFKRLNTLVREVQMLTGEFYQELLISGSSDLQQDMFQ